MLLEVGAPMLGFFINAFRYCGSHSIQGVRFNSLSLSLPFSCLYVSLSRSLLFLTLSFLSAGLWCRGSLSLSVSLSLYLSFSLSVSLSLTVSLLRPCLSPLTYAWRYVQWLRQATNHLTALRRPSALSMPRSNHKLPVVLCGRGQQSTNCTEDRPFSQATITWMVLLLVALQLLRET